MMKLSLLVLPLAVVTIASATWSTSVAHPAPADTVGIDYKFRDLPLNSMGVKSLADLRGKPILIDFWGQH